MSPLQLALEQYLALRRALGFKLEREGWLLPKFVDFVESQGETRITTNLALRWATQPAGASVYWWARRLSFVRQFAMHMLAEDPRTEVPPADLIPYRTSRATPYLYSEADIRALMEACSSLRGPIAASTYRSLLGLLAATGMRVGEALALDRSDLDQDRQLLVIRRAKFNKTREVPLDRTVMHALRAYGAQRDHHWRRPRTSIFFVSNAGRRLWPQNVWKRFDHLRRCAKLPARPRPPRIHDLRHSFAVTTLLRWYREGADIEARLPALSTYMGHVNPSSTYWYLSAAPELLVLAAERLDRSWRKNP